MKKPRILPFAPKPTTPPTPPRLTKRRTPSGGLSFTLSIDTEKLAALLAAQQAKKDRS